MKISYRAQTCTAEGAFEILAKANALEREKGIKVIHLEIGEPDFVTPKNIREACKKAIDEGYTHYAPANGLPELRQAVSEHLTKTRNIDAPAGNILISAGGKLLIYSACAVFLEEGDEAIYPDPGYPPYRSAISLAGGKPVPLILTEENDYKVDIDQLASLITPKTRLIILNSPHNPTGSVLSKTDLLQISEIVKDSNAVVFSDEIYSQLIYSGEPHITIASMPGMKDRTILMDGMSKTFAMTGWRLAYALIPTEYYIPMQKIISNTVSCTTTFVQIAGIEALKGDQTEVKKMYNEFKEKRELMVKLVNEIPGMHAKMPSGAFYVFANVKEILQKYELTSKSLADHLLYEAGVACLGGSAFGEAGEGYLRFSYANSKENITEAMRRIKEVLNNNYKV
jgi:aspartate/methionine/tyrosine aminotransferase